MSSRTQAAEAYIRALRTGEPSATQAASQFLAPGVVPPPGAAPQKMASRRHEPARHHGARHGSRDSEGRRGRMS